MAYIGRGIDNISQIEVLDIITFTNSAGPYNILKSSVAFTPSTPQSLLIEVDGIIQAPASYTITGSTITFGVSMPSSSTMNSILHFGTGIITTPADLSVTTAKIATDAVTTAKILDNNVTVAKLPTTLDISGNTVTLPASVSGLGTGITNAQLAGSITDAKITGLSSSKLSGALPAISGASLTALPATLPASSGVNLTALNATNLGSGTVPTARLGTGTADGTTFLRGDQTYAAAGGGKILQVVQANKTDTWTSSANSTWTDVTGLSVTTGPLASTSSRVLVMISICVAGTDTNGIKIVDGSSADIAGFIGDAAGSRIRSTTGNNYWANNYRVSPVTGNCIDSPSSTDAQTYKIQMYLSSASTMRVNYANNDADSNVYFRGVSSITAIEIGA